MNTKSHSPQNLRAHAHDLHLRAASLLTAAGMALGSASGCSSLHDNALCEEAAAHIAECCPPVDASAFDCQEGITGYSIQDYHDPAFSDLESKRILTLNCSEIQWESLCTPR